MIMLNFRLKEPLMLKAVSYRFKLNTTKAYKIVPKIDIMNFLEQLVLFSVMAEGGKGNVDDGKSTDGKKEKQFN